MTDRPVAEAPDTTALLLETESLDDFLQALARSALALVAEADGCGITVQRQGRPVTVSSAGAIATKLDEAQYGQDDGPCLQAMRTGLEVSVPDTLRESRWADYPAYAAVCGARSSLSLPIAPHSHTAGALNLYAPVPGAFENADLTALRLLTAQATGAIALAQRIADTEEFAADLEAALRSRTVIDQAIGVVTPRSSPPTWRPPCGPVRSSTRRSAWSSASSAAPRRRPSRCCARPPSTATSSSAISAPN